MEGKRDLNRKQKKELRERQSTRQLMGITQLTDHGVKTAKGELVFFMLRPDNLSVLSPEGVRGRVTALTNLLRATPAVRLLALDSRESVPGQPGLLPPPSGGGAAPGCPGTAAAGRRPPG